MKTSAHHNVVVIGKTGQVATELRLLKPDWHFFDRNQCDLAQLSTLESTLDRMCTELKPKIIINAAAYTKVDLAEEESVLCDDINHKALAVLSNKCERYKVKLVQISTDYVFDGKKNVPYVESDLARPLNQYGQSKLLSEKAITTSGCRHVIYRTSWVYSTHGQNFLKTMLKLIPERNLNIVFDQVGTPTSAFDIAKLIIQTADVDFFPNKLYHYSHEGVASWYDFAVMIKRLYLPNTTTTLLPILSANYPQKANRPSFSVMNKENLKRDLALKIDHWVEGLTKVQLLNNRPSKT